MAELTEERYTDPWKERLAELYDGMRNYAFESLSFEDKEDLHQARVNNRKLLTLVQALHLQRSVRLLPPLKKLQKLLGRVRDRDVMIQTLKERKKLTGDKKRKRLVKQLIRLQKSERKTYRKKLRKRLPKLLNRAFDKRWSRMLQDAEQLGRAAGLRLIEQYQELEYAFDERRIRYEQLKQERGMTDPAVLEALHKVRISIKKLRYLLMQMDFVIEFDAEAKRLYFEELQDRLGRINDVRVELERLKSVSPQKLDVDAQAYRRQMEELADKLTEELGRLQIPRTVLS